MLGGKGSPRSFPSHLFFPVVFVGGAAALGVFIGARTLLMHPGVNLSRETRLQTIVDNKREGEAYRSHFKGIARMNSYFEDAMAIKDLPADHPDLQRRKKKPQPQQQSRADIQKQWRQQVQQEQEQEQREQRERASAEA